MASFIIGLAASCGVVAHYRPPSVPDIAEHIRYFAENKDRFDTIFVGSSRMQFQIDPHEFDGQTGALGQRTHSLNLGHRGMWPPESYYYLRQVLALHPRRLRWVVIELMDYRFGKLEYQARTMRMVVWHDWKHTAMAFRVVMETPQPAVEKFRQATMHTELFLQHMLNPGQGAVWLRERYFPAKKKTDSLWEKRAGFDPQAKGEWSDEARAGFEKEVQAFEALPAPASLRPGLASALRDLIADVHRAGAEPIFVAPPSVRPEEKLAGALPQGMTVWAYNDPVAFPRLYLPEVRCDPGHLNEDGAREFTTLLAQRLADLAKKR